MNRNKLQGETRQMPKHRSIYRHKLVLIVLLAVCVSAESLAKAGQVEYSTQPLEQKPIMDWATVVVDFTRFNNWLGNKHASLTPGQVPSVREHTYLLIDSVLKNRQGEGRTAFNDFEHFSLRTLFNWASRLGVYGSGLVAKEFTTDSGWELSPPLLPKSPIQLDLQFPYFVLSSQDAPWRFRFPYYFMIWQASRSTVKNGLLTDTVVASTSFSNHNKLQGQSQATIMFIYSPKADCDSFNRFWMELLNINPSNRTNDLLLPASLNYRTIDLEKNLHKELTFLSDTTGCYALGYTGIGGPYEANRVHYLDFLKSLDRTAEQGTQVGPRH